jgi:hypothetical protein
MMSYEKAARELPFLGFMFEMPIVVAGVRVSGELSIVPAFLPNSGLACHRYCFQDITPRALKRLQLAILEARPAYSHDPPIRSTSSGKAAKVQRRTICCSSGCFFNGSPSRPSRFKK